MSNQDTVNKAAVEAGVAQARLSRDELRARVFAADNKKPKSKTIVFFGVEIELRQGTLSSILAERDNKQAAIVDFLIGNAYVPGTNERAFEEGDAEQFMTMPFGEDFVKVTKALEELSGVNFLVPSGS